jgi:hypothetical protein
VREQMRWRDRLLARANPSCTEGSIPDGDGRYDRGCSSTCIARRRCR